MPQSRIIRESFVEDFVEYQLEFAKPPYDREDTCFSFPCDQDGIVDTESLNPDALRNYTRCMSGEDGLGCVGVERFEWSYRNPAVLGCACGQDVQLEHFTNTCEDCGADYNKSGQLLAPRSCWGEETGEHPSDIARIA